MFGFSFLVQSGQTLLSRERDINPNPRICIVLYIYIEARNKGAQMAQGGRTVKSVPRMGQFISVYRYTIYG